LHRVSTSKYFCSVGAIGKVISHQLTETRHTKVVLAGQDQLKAEMSVNEIIEMIGNPEMILELADGQGCYR